MEFRNSMMRLGRYLDIALDHPGERSGVSHSLIFAAIGSIALTLALAFPAFAQTLTVLHSFNGNDGAYPFSRLLFDNQGDLYGATGGALSPTVGSIFELLPGGGIRVLLTRPSGGVCHLCLDNLLRDQTGNLYGTDPTGGTFGNGAVFKVNNSGTFSVLYSFTGAADGKSPNDGLIADGQGNIYGTTGLGGAHGQGVVFKLTASGVQTVLHAFTGGADGGEPWGRLLRDSAGNLYGTTYADGGNQLSFGVVFKLSPSGVETVLHSFAGGNDGGHPNGDLIADAQGNLYGTTLAIPHGAHGTVFKITPQGVETVLHRFAGPEGFSPRSGVIMDAGGSLYGTTFSGGASNNGVVYRLSAAGSVTVLHNFSGSDGAYPVGGLVFDQHGNLYGMTAYGGTSNDGVVFKLTP